MGTDNILGESGASLASGKSSPSLDNGKCQCAHIQYEVIYNAYRYEPILTTRWLTPLANECNEVQSPPHSV